jgi:hypothetical protein
VGRGADGTLRYFVLDDTPMGSMAEKTVIEVGRSVVLPDDVDPIVVAAALNPAMGSWLALRCRIPFTKGQRSSFSGRQEAPAAWPCGWHIDAVEAVWRGKTLDGRIAANQPLK